MKPQLMIVMLCLSCSDQPTKAKRQPACKVSALRVSFDDAPLAEVAAAVGAATCLRFRLADEVKDERMTLLSTVELAPSDLLSGFTAALSGRELTLQPEGTNAYLITRPKE